MSNATRKSLLTIGSGLVVAAVLAFSSAAAVPSMVTLSGHVPAIVSQLESTGSLPLQTNLNLAIGLPLRNQAALTNLLAQIYDPTSTNYHQYLTPEQFTAQFGPTETDYQAVINFAQQNGLTVVGTHPNRVLVDVAGTVATIQQAFHVTLLTYTNPVGARPFFAPNVDPTVAATLPILHISGLDNYYLAQPNLKAVPAGSSVPHAGSAPGGAYQGSDFRKAYVPGTPLNGAGQNVGLLQFDGFFASDIAAYANQIGLTTNVPNLVVVPINGGVPNPDPNGPGIGEVSLDIEMILSMSPGVSNIYVYEAPNPSPWVDLLSRMANDNLAKQLSCSWGGGPPDPVAEQIFQQMAIQGQTFFTASGDGDAFVGPITFPSDSPHITTVGATTLTTGQGPSYASETVWNWGVEYGDDGVGSSGGISTYYSIPSWQTNINMTARQGSTTMRNVPDVALTGDNVWVIYGGGQTGAFGGTSCAAPLWAGFTALVNQQATNNGHASVGFLNPALYTIAASSSYTNCFHDTTTGNNKWSGSPNLFGAFTNYDLCTGLGTPNGTNLINALTAVSATNPPPIHISAPLPPYGSTLSALNGGNPNGNWALFVQDDQLLDSGVIFNGWFLTLTTANPVGSSADLALTMVASSSTVIVGGTVTYTIGVTNYGVSISSNAVALDTLPFGVTLVGNNTTQGSVTRSGAAVTWNIGTLAINAGAQLTLTVQVTATGNILNYATASANTSDPNPDNNSASTSVASGTAVPPQLSGIIVSNGTFQFAITSYPGQTNVIQASTNLVNWIPIFTNIGSFIFTDTQATNYHYRFYRDQVIGP